MLFNKAFYASPYTTYERLQREGGVHKIHTPQGESFWLITRYADVRHILHNSMFSISKDNAGDAGYRGFSLPPALNRNLLNLDPPDHTRLRALTLAAWNSLNNNAIQGTIRNTIHQLLDTCESDQSVDIVTQLATPLPLAVIGDLLGVPHHALTDFRTWTTALLAPDSPSETGTAAGNLYHFIVDLIEKKRCDPGDDLLSHAILGHDHDGKLDTAELISLAFLLLWAGYENVAGALALNILTLTRYPELQEKLATDPSLIASSVEEFLRYDGSAQAAIRRFPLHDTTINDTHIPAGGTVICSLAAANRDPDKFPHPHTVDISRNTNGHLAFGYGIHYCLAAPLARTQLTLALTTLLERFPSWRLAINYADVPWQSSWRNRAPLSLPIRFSAQR